MGQSGLGKPKGAGRQTCPIARGQHSGEKGLEAAWRPAGGVAAWAL